MHGNINNATVTAQELHEAGSASKQSIMGWLPGNMCIQVPLHQGRTSQGALVLKRRESLMCVLDVVETSQIQKCLHAAGPLST